MVQNNKVLTVSYGTFSCTLEGFEDSFDTMKAIAEYFRDLAADDRYFGAEPPQPDADMLANIAQREISRQVEARQSAEGIHLRAAETALPAATPVVVETPVETPAAPEPQPEPQAEAAPEPQPEPQAELQPEPESAPREALEDAVELVSEPAVEEAPAVEVAAIEPAEEEDAAEAEPVAEAEPANEVAEVEAIEEPVTEEPEVAEHVQDEPEADMPEIMAEKEDEDDSSLYDAELVPEQDNIVPAADSIAAKLQRIRAVVTGRRLETDETQYTEDEHAEAYVEEAAQDISEALAEDDGIQSAFAADDEYEEDYQDDGADEIAAVLSRYDHSAGDEDASESEDQPEMVAEASEPETPEADEEEQDLSELDFEWKSEPDSAEAEEEIEESDAPRVFKVKRAEMEEALDAGILEPIEDETEDNAAGSSLSAEEEEDLQRELDAVKAGLTGAYEDELDQDDSDELDPDFVRDFDQDFEDEDDGENLFQENEDEAAAARRMTPAPDTDEDDVSRLMAAADEKLEDPELTSSRDTYNQLRAAVAAAEAERSAGGEMGEQSDADAYRDDLANVVRPRRPATGGARDKRPEPVASRAAPLKLVAEQRVDGDVAQPQSGPVRPRRISTQLQDVTGEEASAEGGFAAYAAEVGAVELSQLLEAAAAYLSFVEGHEQFSRPQLMNKLRQLETPAFNREDGLRSFGQLLREGKIEKTGGGRFTASGDIGFQPDEREAS